MGDQNILGIDTNDSIKHGLLVDALRELGMTEAILGTHSPTSCWQHTTGIPKMIESMIFLSLQVSTSHRPAWQPLIQSLVGLLITAWVGSRSLSVVCLVLGSQLLQNWTLQISNVTILANVYNISGSVVTDVYKFTRKIKLLCTLGDQFLNGEIELLPTIIDKYHTLHETSDQLRRHAAKDLPQKHAGGDPKTPTLQDFIDPVDYWAQIVKVRPSISTSKNKIKNLAKKLKCNHGQSATQQEAQYKLEMAKLDQKNAKAAAPDW